MGVWIDGPNARTSQLKFDALREREVRRPVDGGSLAPHIGLPRIAAGLAAAARLLFSAKRAADLRATGADVDVGDTAVAAPIADERLRGSEVGGEHGRG